MSNIVSSGFESILIESRFDSTICIARAFWIGPNHQKWHKWERQLGGILMNHFVYFVARLISPRKSNIFIHLKKHFGSYFDALDVKKIKCTCLKRLNILLSYLNKIWDLFTNKSIQSSQVCSRQTHCKGNVFSGIKSHQ